MVSEIYCHGDYVMISTQYQTIADKRAIIERAKTTIRNMWADRRVLQRELAKQLAKLRTVSKKSNPDMFNNIKQNILDLNKKIARREDIIHQQIDMIKRESAWIKHLRREDRAVKELRKQERLKCAATVAVKSRIK